MQQLMEADIVFYDPDTDPGIAVLVKYGFEVEVIDRDAYSFLGEWCEQVHVQARITTDIDENEFFDWVISIVEPLGGDTLEAGFAVKDAAKRATKTN